jgi:succinate-semialdehyde dehydrogenase/glutarate-semialdehyde dehydrogenase
MNKPHATSAVSNAESKPVRGLSAGNADRLANDIEVGNLSINHFVASVAETPFGGVKDSSYGREGGTEGLQGYTVAKNISHKMMAS